MIPHLQLLICVGSESHSYMDLSYLQAWLIHLSSYIPSLVRCSLSTYPTLGLVFAVWLFCHELVTIHFSTQSLST